MAVYSSAGTSLASWDYLPNTTSTPVYSTYSPPLPGPKCAHCLVRKESPPQDAVTFVDGTSVCAKHADQLLTLIYEED